MAFERKRMHPSSGMVLKQDNTIFDLGLTLSRSVDVNNILHSLSYTHSAVHRDVIVNATSYAAAATTELVFFFHTGTPLQAHLEYVISGGAALRAQFYEGPTVATPGTEVVTTRLFRPSTKTTQATITVGGTVTGGAYGTLLKDQYNGGSGGGANISGGSAVHSDGEFVLNIDTTYCLRITRDASQIVGVEWEWYEVPEIK